VGWVSYSDDISDRRDDDENRSTQSQSTAVPRVESSRKRSSRKQPGEIVRRILRIPTTADLRETVSSLTAENSGLARKNEQLAARISQLERDLSLKARIIEKLDGERKALLKDAELRNPESKPVSQRSRTKESKTRVWRKEFDKSKVGKDVRQEQSSEGRAGAVGVKAQDVEASSSRNSTSEGNPRAVLGCD